MIAGMPKRPARVEVAFYKLTTYLGGYLSRLELERLLSIQSDTDPHNNIEDNKWLLEMEDTVHKRIRDGYIGG